MSVTDALNMQPNGTFHGSVAGVTSVDLSSNGSMDWKTGPPKNGGTIALIFPGGTYPSLIIQDWITID